MKNIRILLIIFLILSVVTTVIAASLTVTTISNIRGTFYVIALCFYLILVLLGIFDIVRSKLLTTTEKLLWIFVILFGSALGVLIYLLVGKKEISARERLNG